MIGKDMMHLEVTILAVTLFEMWKMQKMIYLTQRESIERKRNKLAPMLSVSTKTSIHSKDALYG